MPRCKTIKKAAIETRTLTSEEGGREKVGVNGEVEIIEKLIYRDDEITESTIS